MGEKDKFSKYTFILESIKDVLTKILEENYDIKVNKVEKIDDSTDGNVFIVYTQNNKYIIKIYNNLTHTKSMIELHSKLLFSGLNVPEIIQSNNNMGYVSFPNGNYIVIYSFMKGKQIASDLNKSYLDYSIVSLIARALRKLHTITNGENIFNLPNIPFAFESGANRNSVLHFDLTKHNIFMDNDSIGFIDFDDSRYGPSVCDVAIIIAILFFSKSRGTDIEGVHKFIEEYYYNETELMNKELPLIKNFALKWIDYILHNNEFDTSTTDSFVVKRSLIVQNL